MKAAVVHEFGSPLSIEELPKPEPGPGQVVVQVETSGLCHTDIHAAHGDWPVKPAPPFVPGHEGVGLVERVGAGVTRLREGDRVAVPWLGWACGACEACASGWETLCEPPWVRWRLLALETRMESCQRRGRLGSRRHVGTRRRRRNGRCERSVSCARSWARITGRSAGWRSSSAIGTESLRSWVKQAEVDAGVKPGVTSAEAARVKELEQENRELRRANEILRRASAYFAQAELDRPWK